MEVEVVGKVGIRIPLKGASAPKCFLKLFEIKHLGVMMHMQSEGDRLEPRGVLAKQARVRLRRPFSEGFMCEAGSPYLNGSESSDPHKQGAA